MVEGRNLPVKTKYPIPKNQIQGCYADGHIVSQASRLPKSDGGGTTQRLQDAGDTIPLFQVSLRPSFLCYGSKNPKMNKKAERPFFSISNQPLFLAYLWLITILHLMRTLALVLLHFESGGG